MNSLLPKSNFYREQVTYIQYHANQQIKNQYKKKTQNATKNTIKNISQNSSKNNEYYLIDNYYYRAKEGLFY